MAPGFDTSSEEQRGKTWRENASTVTIRGKAYPYIYPSWSDARVIQIAALSTYAILGQTIYHFQVNILQIVACVGTAALVDLFMNFWLKKIVLFPASGMIAGLGMAMMLRVRPGPLSVALYVIAAAISVLSKYVFTTGWSGTRKHIFNPSNFGISVMFLLLPSLTYPTPQQWDKTWWLMIIISVAGIALTYSAKVLTIVVSFLLTEIAMFIVHEGVLLQAGLPYFLGNIVPALLSPALVVFSFHMITDPRTIPEQQHMRIVFSMIVAMVHWILVSMGFSIRSVFLALFVVSMFVPLMNRLTVPGAPPFRMFDRWKKKPVPAVSIS